MLDVVVTFSFLLLLHQNPAHCAFINACVRPPTSVTALFLLRLHPAQHVSNSTSFAEVCHVVGRSIQRRCRPQHVGPWLQKPHQNLCLLTATCMCTAIAFADSPILLLTTAPWRSSS